MNKYVVITGGSSGIGLELAKAYAANGHNILLVARSGATLQANQKHLEERYAVKTLIFVTDLTASGSVDSLTTFINDQKISISHLINNAGFGSHGEFWSQDKLMQLNMIDLNIRALVELTYQVIPHMLNNGYGKIINVASVAGFMPGPYMSVYYASKAFVLSFSEGLREELIHKNISVSVLCPGPTQSNFWSVSGMDDSNLMKMPWIMTSKQVADYTYEMVNKGKTIIVPGMVNKISSILPRFIPRVVTRKFLAMMQKGPTK